MRHQLSSVGSLLSLHPSLLLQAGSLQSALPMLVNSWHDIFGTDTVLLWLACHVSLCPSGPFWVFLQLLF